MSRVASESAFPAVAWGEAVDAFSDLGFVATSAAGVIVGWSAGAEAITGIAADAAVGHDVVAVLALPGLDLPSVAGRHPPRVTGRVELAGGGTRLIAVTVRATPSRGFALRLEEVDEPRGPGVEGSAQRYARAVDGAGDGVWDWVLATGADYHSPRWKQLLGFAPDELPNHIDTFFARLHPDDVERARAAVAAHFEHRTPYDLDLRLRTKSGEYRWFRTRGEAERDDRGAPVRMTGTMIDVTERKLAELEVQRTNAELERRVKHQTGELRRFVTVIEASTDFIGMADPEGRLLYLNRAFRDALGPHPSNDLWSTRVHELYMPSMSERIEREARPAAIRDGHWLGETELRRFDGTTIPVSQLLLAHISPTGQVEYFSTIMRDDTQRRRMAAELRLRADRLAVAAAAGMVGIWDWNSGDDAMTWDDVMYALYGVARDRFAATYAAWLGTIHEADRARVDDEVRRALREQKPVDTEFRVVWPDRTVHVIRAHGVVHRADSGAPQRMLGTNWDITDIKRAEAEIRSLNADLERRAAEVEASNKELEAFSYTVSHDLRAPLRAIEGYSRIVQEDFAPELKDELQEYLRDIRRNTLHMGRLVDDLLAFSRLGRQAVAKQAVSVERLVEQCLAELRPRRPEREVEVRLGNLPPCLADRTLLKQVWFNLLDNALKYTSKRDRAVIDIAGERRAQETIYSVKDNGVGFDMRFAEKLFGVFQRMHRQEDYEGTGVGLAIVQRMIQRHGGRVWAEAQPDVGATFYFALPRAEHDVAEP